MIQGKKLWMACIAACAWAWGVGHAAGDAMQPASAPVAQAEVQKQVVSDVGLYVGLLFGGYARNLEDNFALAAAVQKANVGGQTINTNWDHGIWGFSFGGEVGYQFTDELALEMGLLWLQPQTYNFNSGTGVYGGGSTYCNASYCFAKGSTAKVSSWSTYVGLKGRMNLVNGFSAFAKLALAYTDNRYKINLAAGSQTLGGTSAAGSFAADTTFWSPALGVGVEYSITSSWRAFAQYMLILGGGKLSSDPSVTGSVISTIDDITLPSINALMLGVDYRFLT